MSNFQIHSVKDFMQHFNIDEKCLKYMMDIKFGEEGWQCYICHYKEYTYLPSHGSVRCKRCGHEETLTSNTIMRNTHKDLTDWFWAIYTIVTNKSGISAMELYRQMDFGSYQTAWSWLQKLRLGMVIEDRDKLQGNVEVDETYLFTGDEQGRSLSGNKVLVVCAVEVYKNYASGRVFLRHIDSASAENLESFVRDHVNKGSTIKTDGWRGYAGLKRLGYDHIPIHADTLEDISKELPRVHRVFVNLKAWIKGTHRYISKKHMQNYLNEFTVRFDNRRRPIEIFNDILKYLMFTRSRTYNDFTEPKKPVYPNPKRA
ncbi:MAG: IS1595 family transposase [Deltaproteobacteria bacterium]|nr:IS1595 family transposase [Deltaproteobacteria bacterium]MCL5792725.1 IS1595 family transposase [Deltaproteobacteria bacterium]